MLSKKDLEELIIKNSIIEESMTPEQIKIRDNFHPAKVELNKMIKMLEIDLLELENKEKQKILNCHKKIKLVKRNTRPVVPDVNFY